MNNPPVPPMPPPLPAYPLGYAQIAFAPSRPGLVTAITIIAILVGLMSLAESGWVSVMLFQWALGSTPPRAVVPPPTLPPAPAYSGEVIPPAGLARDRRAAAIAAMGLDGPFAADRREMAARLLAECGKRVLGDRDASSASFTRHRPAAASDIWSPTLFDTPGGEVSISNRRAEFDPSAGSGTVVVDGDIVTADGQNHWSAIVLDDALATLRTKLPGINDRQAGALISLGQSNSPQPANPSTAPNNAIFAAPIPFSTCQINDRGQLVAWVGSKQWTIFPGGEAYAATTPTAARRFIPLMAGSPWAMYGLATESAVSAIAAIVLGVIAIRILSRWPADLTALIQWSGFKLLLVAMEIILTLWFFHSVLPTRPHTLRGDAYSAQVSRKRYDLTQGQMGLASSCVMQCIFPGVVLGVLLGPKSLRRHSLGFDRAAGALPLQSIAKMLTRIAVVLGLAFSLALVVAGAMSGLTDTPNIPMAVTDVGGGGVILIVSIVLGRRLFFSRSAKAPA